MKKHIMAALLCGALSFGSKFAAAESEVSLLIPPRPTSAEIQASLADCESLGVPAGQCARAMMAAYCSSPEQWAQDPILCSALMVISLFDLTRELNSIGGPIGSPE